MANDATDYLGNIMARADALVKTAQVLEDLRNDPTRYQTDGAEAAILKQKSLVRGALASLEDAYNVWLDK
jgi:hypothetical protein